MTGLNKPRGVWVDAKTKTIFVADTINNRVSSYFPNGTLFKLIIGTGLNGPRGALGDSFGTLVSDTFNLRMIYILSNGTTAFTITGVGQVRGGCIDIRRPNVYYIVSTTSATSIYKITLLEPCTTVSSVQNGCRIIPGCDDAVCRFV